jgi:DNA polymerase-3 subunit epsilon
MNALARLFRPRLELPADLVRRVEAWRTLPAVEDTTPIERLRLVVVDVETTGLDARRDRLLAVGAVAIEGLRVVAGDSFGALLRNECGSGRDNILVHGIGPQAQAAGEECETALAAFLGFARRSPFAAFHAGFDQPVLERAVRGALGVPLLNPFVDVARLAPLLVPEARRTLHASLDEWLGYFGLRPTQRHSAFADAMATAELLLILSARARAQGITTLGRLRAAAEPAGRHALHAGMAGV